MTDAEKQAAYAAQRRAWTIDHIQRRPEDATDAETGPAHAPA